MSSNLRVKAARIISKIGQPESYLLNRFLHSIKEKRIEIEGIISYVPDPPINDLSIEKSSIEYVFYFTKGISNNNISYISYSDVKVLIRFFEFKRTETDIYEWSGLKAEYFNFHNDIFPSVKVFELKHSILSSTTESFSLSENNTNIDLINTEISPPYISDYFSEFVPVIEKIELLDSNDLLNNIFISDLNLYSGNLDFKIPDILKLNAIQITNDFPMMDYQNFDITTSAVCSVNIELPVINKPEKDLVSKPKNHITYNSKTDYKNIFEPTDKKFEELLNEILSYVPGSIHEGIKYLVRTNYALFYNNLKNDKELQLVIALKVLLGMKEVKNVLIITSNYQEMNCSYNGSLQYENVWQSNINKYLSGYIYKNENKFDRKFEKDGFNNNIISCINYNKLEEGCITGTITNEMLNSFDLVILDDFYKDVYSLDSLKLINHDNNLKYLWILSNTSTESMIEISNKIWPEINFKYLDEEVNLLNRYESDYFLDVNSHVANIINECFEKGRKKLDDLIQFGSLLRFQPNVFQIIHDIQKQGNVISGNTDISKIDILIYHVNKIFLNTNRLLIYSQFDKSGLEEIKTALDENGIKNISFKQNDSEKDINDKLKLCHNYDGNLVYLTNIRPNGIRFRFPNVSYLLNYDNWWNPATRWSLENRLDKMNSPLTVINYYINNSHEQRLHYQLNKLGLINKNIFEVIPPDKFYNIFDDKCWGNFFDLSYDMFVNKEYQNYSIINMIDLTNKVKLFLLYLGYKEIELHAGYDTNTYNISASLSLSGEKIKLFVKCIYSNHINSELINSLLTENKKHADKYFIITSGNISHSNLIIPENVSLIDGEQLKTYLSLFKVVL